MLSLIVFLLCVVAWEIGSYVVLGGVIRETTDKLSLGQLKKIFLYGWFTIPVKTLCQATGQCIRYDIYPKLLPKSVFLLLVGDYPRLKAEYLADNQNRKVALPYKSRHFLE